MEHRADLVAVGEPARDLERALFVMLEPHPHRSKPARAQPAIVGRGDLAKFEAGLAQLREMARPGGDRAHHHIRMADDIFGRSEENTSELQPLMRISYAVFCLKKKNRH